ncbi:hypothetical protein RUND412_003239 [Rhizina undulata]
MDALPVEILQEIVSYLKFGPNLTTIFKFRALNVRMTRRGLANLLNVSRQPELAWCVREITYPHGYLVSMRRSLEFNVSSASFTTRFFDWYNDNYVAQIELNNFGECVRALETALSKMGNIRAIIPGYYNYDAYDDLYGMWLRTLTETDMHFAARHRTQIYELIWDFDMLQEVGEAATRAFMDL